MDSIHRAEDRPSFGALLDELGLRGPPYATAESHAQALEVADGVGYPLLVRPSYVLGGRAMEICYSQEQLQGYLKRTNGGAGRTIFLDRFLENAIEIDVDALCDGEDVEIGAIMQHVEEAGRPLGRLRLRDPGDVARPGDAAPGRGGHRRRSPRRSA